MIYLSQLMGNPVFAADGEKIGTVSDLGIATGEVFPRVTSLAFKGPGRTPFMISWRKYVDTYDEKEIHLKVPATEIRFSYLQPDEVLIALSISAVTNPTAELAMEALASLRGSQVHSSVILSSVDEGMFKRLGMNVTFEPVYQSHALYHK